MLNEVTANDAGCWIDGHHGQYATPMMLRIATERGWEGLSTRQHEAMMLWLNGYEIEAKYAERLMDAVDEAEAWLNETVAPDGYSFGWHDGEFFLWSASDWEEA